jgi:hypothetical protein
MLLPAIQSAANVTDDQVNYLANIAQTLSTQDDFAIQNYGDSVITSPDAQQALQLPESEKMFGNFTSPDISFDLMNPAPGVELLALSMPQQNSIIDDIWPQVKALFTGLRGKVRHIFCEVATAWGSDKDLDLKKIIKDVLIALIPLFAASTGLMPVALPIVVSLAAMLLKHGVSKVCPA